MQVNADFINRLRRELLSELHELDGASNADYSTSDVENAYNRAMLSVTHSDDATEPVRPAATNRVKAGSAKAKARGQKAAASRKRNAAEKTGATLGAPASDSSSAA